MSGKLINTLKYGNSKTKRKLYLLLGILALGAVLTIAALMLGNMVLGLTAFAILFADGMLLFNTSFAQKTVSVEKKEKTKKQKPENEAEEPGALEWISSEKEKKEQAEPREKEATAETENPLQAYDEGKLKRIMVAYKVKKHHVTVLIDRCQPEKIIQSPAYLWADAQYLYFLVLEKEPRLVKSDRSKSDKIHIRRGLPAYPLEEYSEVSEPSVVNMIFGNLLPKYYKIETNTYRPEYRKNLYSAAPGIWCTSGSVKNLLKILPDCFVLDDGKTEEESVYFQEIYIARLLYWDGIYSGQEYKEKVLEILTNLARAELSETTVNQYLSTMVRKGLIPQEYADYVTLKRKNR